MKWLMFIPFHLILKPLIKRNYRLRAQGKLPDVMYWADQLAMEYGYFADTDFVQYQRYDEKEGRMYKVYSDRVEVTYCQLPDSPFERNDT